MEKSGRSRIGRTLWRGQVAEVMGFEPERRFCFDGHLDRCYKPAHL